MCDGMKHRRGRKGSEASCSHKATSKKTKGLTNEKETGVGEGGEGPVTTIG